MNPNKPSIPARLLIWDGLGTILLGLGLAEWFADTNLVPEPLQFENYYIVMSIAGVLLMLPILLHVIRTASKTGSRRG